jgi:hypothetical protein
MNAQETAHNPALFSTFIMGLASASMIELGMLEDPIEKKKRVRKEQARQHIDLLVMLQDKTRGNLDTNEKELLERVIVDLKFQFAKVSGAGV